MGKNSIANRQKLLDGVLAIWQQWRMNLADYLTANGLTPTAFARLAGVQASTIFRILDGSRKAGVDVARKITAATNGLVTLTDLRPDLYPPKDGGAA